MKLSAKKKATLKIILTVLAICSFVFFGFIILMSALFNGNPYIALFSFILCMILFVCLSRTIWNDNFMKKTKKILWAIWGVTVIIIVGNGLYDNYVKNIPTVGDFSQHGGIPYWALRPYEPYKGELVAKLNEASTLQLDGELPTIDCATALYPVVASFVQATYPEQDYTLDPWSEEIVSCSTTTGAYEKLINGEVDMIFVAGASDEQTAAAKAKGVELTFTPIGKEAFVFFVNSKNKVDNLTVEQIQSIYSGEIANWKQLGGKNESIRAFQRAKDSGSQTALIRLMDGKNLITPIENDIVMDMGGIIDRTADYKNYSDAIGFSFRFYSTEMVKNNQIKLLKLNGIEPNKDTIRSGEYPVVGDFYAVTAGTENPNVQPLIDWILSPQGQFLIEETGYVSIK